MITRSLLILFILVISGNLLLGQTNTNKDISMKDFTDNPWPFDPSLTTMQEKYTFLKKSKYTVTNRFNKLEKDTIIRLFRGKTEIFFYQPYNGKPLFVTANLYDSRIRLKGDIGTTVSSEELFKKLAYPESASDTIYISLPDGTFKTTLIFKQSKISRIKVEAQHKNLE